MCSFFMVVDKLAIIEHLGRPTFAERRINSTMALGSLISVTAFAFVLTSIRQEVLDNLARSQVPSLVISLREHNTAVWSCSWNVPLCVAGTPG